MSYGWVLIGIRQKCKYTYDIEMYINTRGDGEKGRQAKKEPQSTQSEIDFCVQ